MDELKSIKIENIDGVLSDEIPIGVNATNVTIDENGNKLSKYIKNNDSNINSLKSKDDNLQSQIKSLGNGSPIAAKDVSEMTDINRIYVNITDGNWYYYNGSIWVIGGVYQSTIIENKSITKNHTDFMKYGKNRYNKNTVTIGYYYSANDGNLYENE